MVVLDSVRASDLMMMIALPHIAAATNSAIVPISIATIPGLSTTSVPIKPTLSAAMRPKRSDSPSKKIASTDANRGAENCIEIAFANGVIVKP